MRLAGYCSILLFIEQNNTSEQILIINFTNLITMDISYIIIGFLTLTAAIGFGWFVIAPLNKWAFRIRLKNKMKSKRGYQQVILETVNQYLGKDRP